ncbi:hypothetical protein ECF1_0214 [Enterobacter phage EC-F1]|uniref:Uncharacterized protein n=1 Tax=Flagellimonas marina TaxID=1775168 RepID=A0ABV8PPT7_9FLAO|nr:hypothetical protein ECF1_0214 [Enterobacter phage EC-F1]
MKKLALLLTLVSGFAYADISDNRLSELCNHRDIKDVAVCEQVIAEQLDAAYVWGEENAHLFKRQKLVKLHEFLQSEPMMNLCTNAPNKERCEKLRTYLVDEYVAGIGLY